MSFSALTIPTVKSSSRVSPLTLVLPLTQSYQSLPSCAFCLRLTYSSHPTLLCPCSLLTSALSIQKTRKAGPRKAELWILPIQPCTFPVFLLPSCLALMGFLFHLVSPPLGASSLLRQQKMILDCSFPKAPNTHCCLVIPATASQLLGLRALRQLLNFNNAKLSHGSLSLHCFLLSPGGFRVF